MHLPPGNRVLFDMLHMSDSQEILTAHDGRSLLSSTRPSIHPTSLLLYGQKTLPSAYAGLQKGHDATLLTFSTELSALRKEQQQVNHRRGRCTPANN